MPNTMTTQDWTRHYIAEVMQTEDAAAREGMLDRVVVAARAWCAEAGVETYGAGTHALRMVAAGRPGGLPALVADAVRASVALAPR